MNKPLLNDPNIFPTLEVIDKDLGATKETYHLFLEELKNKIPIAAIEWRFYNDGKSWLGKGLVKKKTLFWLSIWEGYFKISIFFNEKTIKNFDSKLLSYAEKNASVGRIIPVIYAVNDSKQLEYVLKALEYKKSVL